MTDTTVNHAESITEHELGLLEENHFNDPDRETKIFKDQCMYCFTTPYFDGGLFVCLKTFAAFCRKHIDAYASHTGSVAFVQVLSRKEKIENLEPEEKISRLAVGADGGFCNEKFDIVDEYYFVLYPELQRRFLIDAALGANLYSACNKVATATSAERLEMLQSASNAWDGEQKKITKFADMVQFDTGKIIPYSGWKCEEEGCDLTQNLWLNLADGAVRCGRSQFISEGNKSKGNNHMKAYYDLTGYPLVVKLGTIEKDGNADVFSYEEDDAVIDPNLRRHLAHFGLDIDLMEKTEKSTLELELDMNQKWEWSRIQEDGAHLENAYGPALTGLINIGSSCYMNSVIQALILIPDFRKRFGYENAEATMHALPPVEVFKDFNAQFARLVSAMLSGDYSKENFPHNGIKPTQFKRLAGAGHLEFSTAKQQDAEEYVRYIIEKISALTPPGELDPTQALKFQKEERLCDIETQKVRYTNNEETLLAIPVPQSLLTPIPGKEGRFTADFQGCLQHVFEQEQLNDRFVKTIRFKTFPDYLFLQLQRFAVDEATYQQKKLDVDIQVPDVLDLTEFRGKGLQSGETLIAENEEVIVPPKLEFDEGVVASLEAMGFSRNAAIKAAIETRSDLEAAAEWVMLHLEDPSINDPPVGPVRASRASQSTENMTTSSTVEQESVGMIEALGFSKNQARVALRKFNFDTNMAAEWLYSHADEVPSQEAELPVAAAEHAPASSSTATDNTTFRDGSGRYQLIGLISHMGSSPHSGHYVAHLLHGKRWVLFNDEKVAYSQNPPKQLAYLYLFQRAGHADSSMQDS